MKIGILLSGCGVYDGSEIQETILTMLAIEEQGGEYICIGIDSNQNQVINHITGEEMSEKRNMLIESARISRGQIVDIKNIHPSDLDALVIPGGFGNAKSFTKWAFEGAKGSILPEVKLFLVNMANVGKPILGLCVSPIVLGKAFEGSQTSCSMTLGSTLEDSPYDIQSFSDELLKTKAKVVMKTIKEIEIDLENRIITAPCYMMNATILEVKANIDLAMKALFEMLKF